MQQHISNASPLGTPVSSPGISFPFNNNRHDTKVRSPNNEETQKKEHL